jgi:hypothetical protein
VARGFVVVAQNTDTVDYVKQAYALALSIKCSQKIDKSISIITNDIVPDAYKLVFDYIVPIPWIDEATDTKWKVENRWKIFHVTPYDETIVLDTDMLLLEDISTWWEYCTNYDLKFCSKIKNYKLDYVVDTYHRKAFTANNLSNPYFALHYFKKTELAYDFYKVLEFVSNNWEWCYTKFAPVEYQEWLSMDLAAAIAIEIMGLHEIAIDKNSPLEFIHMKTPNQGWMPIPSSWQDTVPYILNKKGELIVGNIKQSKLFHYVEKNFVTDKLIERLMELSHGA